MKKGQETQEKSKKEGRPKARLRKEPEAVPENITEDTNTAKEEAFTENTDEKETEAVPENDSERTGTILEDGTEETEKNPEGAGVEETEYNSGPATEGMEAVPEDDDTGTEPESNTANDNPVTTLSVQAANSPLRMMKQEFRKRSQVIREQMRNIQNAFITIGFQLHWVRENNMYRVLNYKNVYEFAEKEYGIKKTTCCNFISIIENYAERDENNCVVESINDCYRNYSASQLVAMLGMSDEMKKQVSPDMSVRAINRLRKVGQGKEPEAVVSGAVAETTAMEEPIAVAEVLAVKEIGMDDGTVEAAVPDDAAQYSEAAPDEIQGSIEMNTDGEGSAAEPVERGEGEESAGADTESPGSEKTQEDAGQKPEQSEMQGTRTGGSGMPEEPAEDTAGIGNTLAEIDSYNDYQSMAEELDLLMRHVFSAGPPVRVKIVCVQG